MINYNTLIVWDTETGGVNPESCEVLQIAAIAINPRTLKLIEGSEFNRYVKPKDWNNVEEGALKVNNLTKDFIDENGFELKTAWNDFVSYLQSFNKKKSFYTAPIPCGANIRNFDMIIFERLCKEFNSPKDLFFKRNSIDTLDLCFLWFESLSEPAKYNMDTLRDFFGIDKQGAHNAITDCKQCADIICRFLKFHRSIASIDKFKGKFSNKI